MGYSRLVNRLSRWLLLVLVAVLATGCASLGPARRRAETAVVRQIRFEGNGTYLSGHNDYQLRTQMEQGVSSPGLTWPVLRRFVDGVPLDEEALQRDTYRLEVWYAHNGWFDARVVGWTIVERRPEKLTRRERSLRWLAGHGSDWAVGRLQLKGEELRARRKAPVVDIVGRVEPGEPSTLRSFEWTGLEQDKAATTLLGAARRSAYLQEGYQFSQDYLDLTRDQVADKLGNHGYPYTRVEAEVDAWPEEHVVDARLRISRGTTADFGPITISGAERVPEHLMREALGFEPGIPYKVSTLRAAQRNLFSLGTFSVVGVKPDLSDPTSQIVPVDVQVTESRFGTAKAGGGLTINATTVVPRVSLSLKHVNLYDHLVRGEVGGWAGLYLSSYSGGRYPAYQAHVQLTHPRFFHRRLSLSGRLEMEQDLQSGELPYRNPEARGSLAWRLSERTTLSLGAGFEQFHYLQLTGTARLQARAIFGRKFENPYQLTTTELRLNYDSRDEPLNPTSGTWFQAHLRQAVMGLFSDYAYTDVGADWRRHYPLRQSGRVLAVRAHGRALRPWGDSDLPYPELAFLGGATSLRGFRPNGVGGYDCLCTYDADKEGAFSGDPGEGLEATRRYLPVGGSLVVGGSAELRHPFLFSGLTMALPFVDVGVLTSDVSDLTRVLAGKSGPLRWGAGLGFRYDTVVGPVRFDLAARPLYPEDLAPEEYTGCYLDDRVPRTLDWIDGFARLGTSLSQTLSRWWDGQPPENYYVAREHPPVVIMGYLAIGQAF